MSADDWGWSEEDLGALSLPYQKAIIVMNQADNKYREVLHRRAKTLDKQVKQLREALEVTLQALCDERRGVEIEDIAAITMKAENALKETEPKP